MKALPNNIALGSASPRRLELMTQILGYQPEVISVSHTETVDFNLKPSQVALDIALQKYHSIRNEQLIDSKRILVTADTIVLLHDQIIGKPKDIYEAKSILKRLSGTTHTVITGVCVGTESNLIRFDQKTHVHFHPITDHQIDHYIHHSPPLDKAGAYGIQDWIGLIGIERIEGCFYNVMGLPTQQLFSALHQLI